MRPVGTSQELGRRRQRAVALIPRGESPTVLARILGVCRTWLCRWLARAQAAPEGLAAKPHPGPRPRLTGERLKGLEDLLLQRAKAHSRPDQSWTAGRIAEVIRRHFGIAYHVAHVRKIIKRRPGRTSQEPQRRAKGRNPEVIAPGRDEELPRIIKPVEEREA